MLDAFILESKLDDAEPFASMPQEGVCRVQLRIVQEDQKREGRSQVHLLVQVYPGEEPSGLWTTISCVRDRNSRSHAVSQNQLSESVTMAMSFKNR